MERLKRSLSFRKKKDRVPECSKPHQWQEDERKVREGTCSFQVRYLGCIEVFESRGIQVCEEAVKALKARKNRSLWSRMSLRRKPKDSKQSKSKYQRAILYVSGDALRVVDEISKGLVVDQTIEKVSFCAPDRNHEKGFAYICRDGTTRRWICHGFLALKESVSGERLSHAVGCAFAICLEKKQKREKDSVTVTFNDKGTSFTRMGSFRQATLTERLADPQSAIIADPVPVKSVANPFAVQRPHATESMLERQYSFRGFDKLSETSPFKRQFSLRLNELPSTLERQKQLVKQNSQPNGPAVSPIPEVSPSKEQQEIADMCQQLTQGLSALNTDESFTGAPNGTQMNNVQPTNKVQVSGPGGSIQPIQQPNPWEAPPAGGVSMADFWLHSTASSIAAAKDPSLAAQGHPIVNGGTATPPPNNTVPFVPVNNATPFGPVTAATAFPVQVQVHPTQRAPHISHLRSHSVDTANMYMPSQNAITLHELSQQVRPIPQFQSEQNGSLSVAAPANGQTVVVAPVMSDPFEAAWQSKAITGTKSTNPFQAGDTITKAFEVKL